MKITKYGHACLLVEEKNVRLLIDPGSFSQGFEDLSDINAVLFTHQHADHLDVDKLIEVLKHNPQAIIVADEGSATKLDSTGADLKIVHTGDQFEVDGLAVEVIGTDHALLHQSIDIIPNVGYLIDGRMFDPGDAYTLPGRPVEILALPIVAPWSKVEETANYLAEVNPKIAFPIHDAVASMPAMYQQIVSSTIKNSNITLRTLEPGQSFEA
jgi:L-ascorbate metabolism protein UlaG (beta-lactamase superfamily)